LVDRLLAFAREQPLKPILFYQSDADLLLVSRHRQQLTEEFELLVPEADLVETLVDKARFQHFATELQLPIPKSTLVSTMSKPPKMDLSYPVIVKPRVRQEAVWSSVGSHEKAVLFESRDRLLEAWPRIAATGSEVLVQELVPGPERNIESYHAYIDGAGELAGEFTGKKIRTLPLERGHSTALEITDAADVAALGRHVLGALGLRGVGKVDFKRAPDGRLCLLEVNPRFTLWNNPGSVAGVNIPAMVYADLAGYARPEPRPIRRGVRWCDPILDKQAAQLAGIGYARWLLWAARCETKHAANWDDPLPFLRKRLIPFVTARWHRAMQSVRRRSRASRGA